MRGVPCPTYVLSLPGSVRRHSIQHHLDARGIAFEFVDGVLVPPKGRDAFCEAFLRDELGSTAQWRSNSLSHGSLGCALAFLRLIARASTRTMPCLVLEDDAVFNPRLDAGLIQWSAILERTGSTDVAFLHVTPVRCGCVAMIIHAGLADFLRQRLQEFIDSNMPIDLFLWNHPDIRRFVFQDLVRTGLFCHRGFINDSTTSERMRINQRVCGTANDHH